MPVFILKNGGETLTGSSGNDTITGGTGNDRILSGDGADLIDGGDGNDQINGYPTTGNAYSFWTYSGSKTINGGNGDDFIYGADGADSISGGNGNDTVYGSLGNDSIEGSLGDDLLSGGTGNDSISGGLGNDSVYGGDGNDSIDGGLGIDYLSGGDGNDILVGGDSNDDLFGGAGNDSLVGGSGNEFLSGDIGDDSLAGGDGNDSFNGGAGNDIIQAGAGDDEVSYKSDIGNDTVYGGEGNDFVNYFQIAGDKLIYGESGNDSLYGGNGNDSIDGGLNNDYLDGDLGNDYLNGGEGNDSVYGSSGNDTLDGALGNDYLSGGIGNDSLIGNFGNDTVYGGDGSDTILGGDGDDSDLDGGTGNDSISGGNGNDTLWGQAGDDTLDGGLGNDDLSAGAGNDLIQAGAGDDTLNKVNETGNDTVYGGDGNDFINFDNEEGIKLIYGDSGNDSLYGGIANDSIEGGVGNDIIYGGTGNDSILGGSGNDNLWGNEGNDTLDGGDGNDSLRGWAGNDIYIGGEGDDYIYDSEGNNSINVGNGNDTVLGGIDNDLIMGGAGDDNLDGYSGNDTLDGGLGNDTLSGGEGNDTYYIDSIFDSIFDSGGNDTAYVSASFVKIPSSIEKNNVIYVDGAQALPYWIDALLPDEAAGLSFKSILGSSTTINYAFPASIASYYNSPSHAIGYLSFTSLQIMKTKEALTYISSVVNLQFSETNNPSQANTISFANNTQTDSSGYAFYPDNGNFSASDVFLDKSADTTFTLRDGEYQTLTLIHEIGHALGLEHPFSKSGSGGETADPPFLTGIEDSTAWTVMSYTDSPSQNFLLYSPLDIAALQYLYGPSKAARAGNDTYKISSVGPNFVWDGAGLDFIDAGAVTQSATIYLTPGYQGFLGTTKAEKITTAGQITVNFGSVIENLTGSNYDDRLYGNEVGNKIEGGIGNDLIEGWDGDDTLLGGTGNDFLTGGSGNDSIEGGDGNDTLILIGIATNYLIRYDTTSLNYLIESKSGTEGKDTFKSIEFLKFSDKTLAIQSIDLTPPTIAISSNLTSLGISKNSTISFTISETVSDFVLSDVAVTGGILSNFTGSGSAYAATFTPSLNFTGTASIKVANGKFTDNAGNTNEDGEEANNNLTIAIDTQAPVITTFSPENSATKVGVASDIVLTFSEKIQKGTGNVVLKTSAGLTIATYEVPTSSNLTLKDTTLTINPTANLSFDTNHKIEIASGAFKDLFGNDLAGTSTYNFTTVSSIIGTAAGEILNGTASEDNILGYGGNDTITGGLGSDFIDGGTGIDTVIFSGPFGNGNLANYSIQKLINGSWTVSYIGPIIAIFPPPPTDGSDTLSYVERIQFTDKSFAFDLNGNAGNTAKIIGAVLGKTALKNPTYVGIGLSYLDKGMSYSDLGALALNAVGSTTNDAIVSTLWLNVIGSPASALDKAPYIKMLADGMKAGDLAALAADTAFNTSNINLVGLAQTGIEYVPVN